MQSAGGDWESYLRSIGQAALGYDFDRQSGGLILADDLPEPIRQALALGGIHVSRQNGTQTISVPIQFRGDPLGAMTFQLPADVTITDRQRDLLRTISDRLGIALENNRLFERSIAQARRERQANIVGNSLLTSTDIEDILDRAVLSFNETLGAIRTEVLIEPKSLIDVEEDTQ